MLGLKIKRGWAWVILFWEWERGVEWAWVLKYGLDEGEVGC